MPRSCPNAISASAATASHSPGDELSTAHMPAHRVIIDAMGTLRPHRGPNRRRAASVTKPPTIIPTTYAPVPAAGWRGAR